MKTALALVIGILSIAAGALAKPDGGYAGAIRNDNGLNLNTTQVTVATQTSPTQVNATLIVDRASRACLRVANLSTAFRVAVGSHTGIDMSNGFVLQPSTGAGNAINLDAFRGSVYGFGEGSNLTKPSVATAACIEP